MPAFDRSQPLMGIAVLNELFNFVFKKFLYTEKYNPSREFLFEQRSTYKICLIAVTPVVQHK
jgi:hypothetical protein